MGFFKKVVVGRGDRILNMANLINTAINTFTNASIDSLVNGTIDTGLNYTFSSIFNTTFNKNGTEGAVVETVFNLLKSPTFRPIVLPGVVVAAVLLGLFLWWKQCGCCSWCCCSCLKPRGTSACGECNTCQYVISGPVLRTEKTCCSHMCKDPRKMKFLNFRENCQSDCVVFCIHCDKCGKKFVGDTARTLDKRLQV